VEGSEKMNSTTFSGGRYGLASPEFYSNDPPEDSDEAYQLGDDGKNNSADCLLEAAFNSLCCCAIDRLLYF